MRGKITLYTVNTGNYDKIPMFKNVVENIEIVYVTDQPKIATEEFRSRRKQIPITVVDLESVTPPEFRRSPKLASRFVKMHPRDLCGQSTGRAIYMDSKFDVRVLSKAFIGSLNSTKDAMFLKHPSRNSALEEIAHVFKNGLIEFGSLAHFIQEQELTFEILESLKLVNAGFYSVDLDNPLTNVFLETWWDLYSAYGGRDQVYVGLAAQRSGISIREFENRSRWRRPVVTARKHLKRRSLY